MPNPWEVHADDSSGLLIEQCRAILRTGFEKIEHAVRQLDDADVWFRPHASANAIGNILLHLSGNLRQWLIDGLQGTPDVRDRPGEFAERSLIPKGQLLDRLRSTLDEIDGVFDRLDPESLLELRRIQGFDVQVQAAIVEAAAHFQGHVQEIIYITRMRLGDRYAFHWKPAGREQGE